MTNNEYMIHFLQSWLDFAKDTTVNPYRFKTDDGLCDSLYEYQFYNNFSIEVCDELKYSLGSKFKKYNPNNYRYPFGSEDYMDRYLTCTQHECPKRLAFVKQYLSELKGL